MSTPIVKCGTKEGKGWRGKSRVGISKDAVLFAGIWEQANKQDPNSIEFEGIKDEVDGTGLKRYGKQRDGFLEGSGYLK